MDMSMEKEALSYLVELGKSVMAPQVVEVGGKKYTKDNLKQVSARKNAQTIGAHTLCGMVDYISDVFGKEKRDDVFLFVRGYDRVDLMSVLDEDRDREILFSVSPGVSCYEFDRWKDQESFILALQSQFEPTDDLKLVKKVAGNIEARTVQLYGDDGTTQKVTISQGIASKADVEVPNPVTLRPYRTFSEVEQVEAPFVFRIRDNGEPAFKLIEADGDRWKTELIEKIKVYLALALTEHEIYDIPVIG